MPIKIYVTTKRIGFHHWADAPSAVSFLRDKHRHVFHVKATFNVKHEDRDLEFLLMQDKLNDILRNYWIKHIENLGSCEMIATYVLSTFIAEGYCCVSVEVSEDGENGSIVCVS